MKRLLWLLLVLLVGSCSVRTAMLAPRRSPTADHLGVTNNAACLQCHDIVGRAGHQAGEDCLRCHKMSPEGREN